MSGTSFGSRLGRRQTLGGIIGAVASSCAFASSARAAKSPADPYLGTYAFAGGESEREERDKAIEDVVSGMSFVVRGIARDRLKTANPIAAAIAITLDGSSLTVRADTRTHTAPIDGTKVKVKGITGDDMMMHFDISDERLDQIFLADDKGRRNRFVADGRKLTLNVRVHADKLPKALLYRLTYQRA